LTSCSVSMSIAHRGTCWSASRRSSNGFSSEMAYPCSFGFGFEVISGEPGVFTATLQAVELYDWCALEQTARCTREATIAAKPALRRAIAGVISKDIDAKHEEALRHCRKGDITRLWASMDSSNLVSSSGDIIIQDKYSFDTLLHVAVGSLSGPDHQRVLRWLVSLPGAATCAQTKNLRGQTPLHICTQTRGPLVAAKQLVNLHGVNLDSRDNYHSTPLLNAVREEHLDVVALLIERRSDVNAFIPNCHGHGETPLMLAVSLRNLEMTRLLLQDKRIDLHQKSIIGVPFGKEAIDFAPQAGPLRHALDRAILIHRISGPAESSQPEQAYSSSRPSPQAAEDSCVDGNCQSALSHTAGTCCSEGSGKKSRSGARSNFLLELALSCAWCVGGADSSHRSTSRWQGYLMSERPGDVHSQ